MEHTYHISEQGNEHHSASHVEHRAATGVNSNIKILIVVPKYLISDEPSFNYSFPLGLAYISSVLKKAGYRVDILNMNHFYGLPDKLMRDRLDSRDYDLVCTGGTSLDYRGIKIILDTIRSHRSKPKIVLGGTIITTEPELIFSHLQPDFGVIGEGEETMVEIADALSCGADDFKAINGIIYMNKSGETIRTAPRKDIADLDTIPFPDFDGFGYSERLENCWSNSDYSCNFTDNPRPLAIMISRSCPYSCTFCYHFSKYRKRSLENLKAELYEMTEKYKINIIQFFDDCFDIDRKKIYEICDLIKELSEHVGYRMMWTCQMRVETIDPEVLKVMKESGCEVISFGFESYSPAVLKSMKKYITPEKINYAFRETLKNKIAIQGNFIFGDIAETKETIQETIKYWKTTDAQININMVRPYPGSEIYNYCLKNGIIKDKFKFITEDMFMSLSSYNLTKKSKTGSTYNMTHLTDKEYIKLVDYIDKLGRKYVRVALFKKIEETAKGVFTINVTCPFCRKHMTYRKVSITGKLVAFPVKLRCKDCHYAFVAENRLGKLVFKNPALFNLARFYSRFMKMISKK